MTEPTNLTDEATVAFGPSDAPVIFFDDAAAVAYYNGIAAVTLVVTQHRPTIGSKPESVRTVACYLRGNIHAAKSLRSMLDNVILLAEGRPKDSDEAVN